MTRAPRHKSKSRSAVTRLFKAVFDPPFHALPIAAWIYFVWCFLAHPESAVLTGNLPDPDDYMYLDQVIDWLKGQGWYDIIQHRLDPASGVPIVFSRLTMLPMALVAWVLAPCLGFAKAGLVMALLLPPLLFAGLLAGLRWVALPLIGASWASATAFAGIFAAYLVYQFSPGHIDHHGPTALLVLLAAGCAVRMVTCPRAWRWSAAGGALLGFALVVGLEVLPPVIVITAALGLWAVLKGGDAARAVLVYGFTLFASTAIFLGVTKPVVDWLTPDVLGFSIVYVLFTASITLCCAGVALAALTPFRWLRWLAGLGLAAGTGAFYIHTFPSLLGGPYGGMNAELARVMFSSITEALPVVSAKASIVAVLLHILWPSMGLGACARCYRRAETFEMRWAWGLMFALLGADLLLAVFYQIRFMVFAQLFSIIPLTAFLQEGMKWIKIHARGRQVGLMQIGLLLAVAPLPMLILPATVDGRPFNTGILMFPVAKAEYECDMHGVAAVLNQMLPQLVMNEMEAGPELLFRTSHTALGAPFHTDVEGNLDAAKFFSTANPSEAEDIVRRNGAGLVLLCRKMIPLYHMAELFPVSMAEQLEVGQHPGWLEPVHYEGEKDYLLFKVRPPR